jgi:protein Mpv17
MNRSFTSFFLFLSFLASITAFTPIIPSHRFSSPTKVLRNTRKLDFLPQIDNYGNNGGIIVGGGGDGEGGDNNGGGDNNDGGNSNDNNSGGNPLTSALGSFWTKYNSLLDTNPILAKGLTSLVGFSCGDILAQKFINKGEDFDVARLLRLASFGLLLHGPTGHYFYGALDGAMPGTGAVTVATKVAIDQIIWNPIFGSVFFTYIGLTEGKSLSEIKTKLDNDLMAAVKGSWTVWPIAHAINFRFIPSSQRLLYINSIQIGYNVFLSCIANK